MARRESARSVRRGCFLPELRSPFVPGMGKQRHCAAPAAVMNLADLRWQAKPRAMYRANWLVARQVLLREKSRPQAKLLVTAAGWRPPLLEPQD